MKYNFVPVKDVPKARRRNLFELVDEFRRTGHHCCELADHRYCTAYCGANTINKALQREKIYNVQAFARKGKIYLVNHLVSDTMEESE